MVLHAAQGCHGGSCTNSLGLNPLWWDTLCWSHASHVEQTVEQGKCTLQGACVVELVTQAHSTGSQQGACACFGAAQFHPQAGPGTLTWPMGTDSLTPLEQGARWMHYPDSLWTPGPSTS